MAGPAIREIAVDTMYHVHKTSVDWQDGEIAHIGRLQTGLVVSWILRTDASLPFVAGEWSSSMQLVSLHLLLVG